MQDLDVAIAHKDYDTRGGGEVFVRRLAEWLECPVYVGRRNQANEPPDGHLDIREIPLSRLERRAIDRGGLARSVAYMTAWQRAGAVLADYDVVVTSGNEPLWYVPPDDQTLIAYTHSTPRFMYDLYSRDVDGMSAPRLLFNAGKRTLFQHNTARPDRWIANSDRVARRIERYHHVSSDRIETVYPPVNVADYAPEAAPTEEFYLHLGRLVDHKRVGDAVEAFRDLDATLKIAGEGPARDRLESAAPDNVEFLGFVDEARKRELLAGARAHIYPPKNEDFGMVPIESMASGTPVLGVAEGFTEFQIRDGVNGLLFEPGPVGCYQAVRRFERDGVAWGPDRIATFAKQFGERQFRSGMATAIESATAGSEITSGVEFDSVERPVAADGGES